MSFDLTPLIAELGVPAAVVAVGLFIYFREDRKPRSDAQEVPAELKIFMQDKIRDPILKAIEGIKQ